MVEYGQLLLSAQETSPEGWFKYWIDYQKLKVLIYAINGERHKRGGQPQSNSSSSEDSKNSSSTVEAASEDISKESATCAKEDAKEAMLAEDCSAAASTSTAQKSRKFFEYLRLQTNTVSEFYIAKEKELTGRVQELMDEMIEVRVQVETSTTASNESKDLSAKHFRLLNVCKGLYIELMMLENFAVMNYGGIAKILKKHDKNVALETRVKYLNRVVNTLPFATYTNLKKSIRVVEEIFSYLRLLARQPVAIDQKSVKSSHEGDQAQKSAESLTKQSVAGNSSLPGLQPVSGALQMAAHFNTKEMNVLNLLHSFSQKSKKLSPLKPKRGHESGAGANDRMEKRSKKS